MNPTSYYPFPPPTGVGLYEFAGTYNLDTGNLSTTGTGHSVHNNRDVTFQFEVTDRELNVLTSELAIAESPFIKEINIDIIDESGVMQSAYYVSGSSSNIFTFTEAENAGIFNSYRKDFGIRINILGTNAYTHTSEHYVYGNSLEIKSIRVNESGGSYYNYVPEPSGISPKGEPVIGEFETGELVSGQIGFDVTFYNQSDYVAHKQLDIYANSGIDSSYANIFDTGNFIISIPVLETVGTYSFSIDTRHILANQQYQFGIIPSSELATGYPWSVSGYSLFSEEPEEETLVADLLITQAIILENGDSQMNIDFITGEILTNTITTIDTINKGTGEFPQVYEYLTKFKDLSGIFCSSKIHIVNNTSGSGVGRTGISFSEYSISDNSFVNYSVSGDDTSVYLNATITGLSLTPSAFSLYKTSI